MTTDAITPAEHRARLLANRRDTRVGRGRPCPICDHTDWCMADEQAVLCQRANGVGAAKRYSSGWLYILNESATRQPQSTPKPYKRPTDEQLDRKWRPIAEKLHQCGRTSVDLLACKLGVARWSLHALGVGHGMLGGSLCWSFPERSSAGLVLGISRRLPSGEKKTAKGGYHGLFFADNWATYPGPIFLVEGGSDTAALLSLHLAVVGRPSNTGGVAQLAKLFNTRELCGRTLVVVGELDKRRHADLKPAQQARHDKRCAGCLACWPGKYGAVETAKGMGAKVGNRIVWRFPPCGAKDVREWLHKQRCDVNDPVAAEALGKRFVAMMTRGI